MNESGDLFVAISSVCFEQPKTVCWSSSKAMLILWLCKRSDTNYSYLHAHPEIWLFFVFLIHFFSKWTSPRTDFLKYRRLPDSVVRTWRQDVEADTWVLQNKSISNRNVREWLCPWKSNVLIFVLIFYICFFIVVLLSFSLCCDYINNTKYQS